MMRLHAGSDDPSLNGGHGRTNHLLLLETLTDHLKQEGGFVMFERTLRQPCDDRLMVFGLHPAKTQDDVKTALKWVLRVIRRFP